MDALDRLAFDKWAEPDRIRISLDGQPIGRLLKRGQAHEGPYAPDDWEADADLLSWLTRRDTNIKWTRADFGNWEAKLVRTLFPPADPTFLQELTP